MEYIEKIFTFADNYALLSYFVGFMFSFLESFLPVLPLTGIVAIDSAINGLIIGFVTSWIGSVLGTICVYIVLRKFVGNKFDMYIRSKVSTDDYDKYKNAVEKREFLIIFLYYAFPFLPSTLMTILSSSLKIDFVKFAIPMMSGKFLMMFVASYVGSDFNNIIRNPVKIAIVIVISITLYLFASKVQDRIKSKY